MNNLDSNLLLFGQAAAQQQQLLVFNLRANMAKEFMARLLRHLVESPVDKDQCCDDVYLELAADQAVRAADLLLCKLGVVMRTRQGD